MEASTGAQTKSQPKRNQKLPQYAHHEDFAKSVKEHWKTTIEQGDREKIYTRDALGNRMVNRLANDIFNKWLEIEIPEEGNESLKGEIEQLNTRLNVKRAFRRAYMMAMVQGNSLILYGFGDWKDSLEEPPDNVREIGYLRPIPATFIDKIHKDKDESSETWGEITHFELRYDVGDDMGASEKILKIPATRFIHMVNYGVDMDERGLSMLDPLFDDLMGKKSNDFALHQTLKKNASGLYVVMEPELVHGDEQDEAEDEWLDIDTTSMMRLPSGFDAKVLNTNVGLNPKQYIDSNINNIASGSGVGRTALLGVQAGQVAGAKWNFKQYYSFISDQQTEFVGPYLREFYERLQAEGILSEGEFEIVWNPREEVDPEEMAKINQMNTDSAAKLAKMLVDLNATGHDIVVEDDGSAYIRLSDTDKGIYLEGLETATVTKAPAEPLTFVSRPPVPEPTSPLPIISRAQGTNATRLTKAERMKLLKVWQLDTDRLTSKHTAGLSKVISDYQEKWLDSFEELWVLSKMDTYEEFGNVNDVKDLLKGSVKIKPKTRQIQTTLEQILSESYEDSWEQTSDALDIEFEFPIDDPAVSAWIVSVAPMLKVEITTKINQQFLIAIRDGITAGEGYKEINNRLTGITAKYNKGIPNTVHKIVHEAMMKSRADQLQAEGHTKVLWLSVGDERVRDTHIMLEMGSPLDLGEARPYMGDYGCRCTISPYTVLQKLRDKEAMAPGA